NGISRSCGSLPLVRACATSLVEMPETLPVSLVKPFELLGGALISGKLMARKHLRLVVAFEQLLGDRGAQHVDNDGARHGRSWTRAPIETLQLEHAVAQRTVIVD